MNEEKKPIRILHENVIMDPGGIETLLMNVYRHINRNKVQFDFMVHRNEPAFYDDEISKLGGIVYKLPKFSPFPIGYIKYMMAMKKLIRNHPEYKIIHAHSELNLWPLKVAKKEGMQVRIAHSHNAKTKLSIKYFFFLYEKLFIHKYCTNMFMCSTPAGIWSFGKKSVANKEVVFIKNGIETKKFKFDSEVRKNKRNELGVENKFVVGHVGRFMEQKNHEFLIDIFAEVYKRNKESVLILVSDGRLMNKIKEKVTKLGLEKAVIFLGNRSDVNELMQAMDVFVFPSFWEGLPLTCVEAQTAGLPVIMSDVITDEVCITNNVIKKSLKSSADNWAADIFKLTKDFKRDDTTEIIEKSGFDIETTAKWLEEFYIKSYKE